MSTINSEFVMIMISIIALFLTILAGFGAITTFLWNQFAKIHQVLADIKIDYVSKQDCNERRNQCECVKRMDEMDRAFDIVKDKLIEIEATLKARKSRN